MIIGQNLSKSTGGDSLFDTLLTQKNLARLGSEEAHGRRRKQKLQELNRFVLISTSCRDFDGKYLWKDCGDLFSGGMSAERILAREIFWVMKKSSEISPNVLSLYFVSPKNFPQSSLQISVQKKEKNSQTSFGRSAGRKSTLANAGDSGQPRSRLRDVIWKQGCPPPPPTPPPPSQTSSQNLY